MDDQGFKGRYPGGPRRSDEGARAERGASSIPSVGDLEERAQNAARRHARKRRTRRIWIGVVTVLAAAGVAGAWMGLGSHATPEEIADEIDQAAQPSPLTDEDLLRRELIRLQSQPAQAPSAPAAATPRGSR